MSYVIDVLIIIALFTVYAVIHSFLASTGVKKSIRHNFGDLIAFYRVGYNIFALASLYLLYEVLPKPHLIIYDLPKPIDIIILIPQMAALMGIFWSFKYICVKELLGLNQIKRFFSRNYLAELDEESTLTFSGPYKYIRHPIYLFSILFLALRPTMDLFYLTIFLLVVLYFYVGSVFEEKKLKAKFGEVYINYQKYVPRIFPLFPIKAYEPEYIQATDEIKE